MMAKGEMTKSHSRTGASQAAPSPLEKLCTELSVYFVAHERGLFIQLD
jgi:hypothetical protein